MSLRESENFFFHLCTDPKLMPRFQKNPKAVLKKFFKSKRDRDFLLQYDIERFETYRNHIHYGIFDNLRTGFPVIHSILSETEWNTLLNDFYQKKLCRSSIARQVFREFSEYLQKYRGPLIKKFPFLHELAHYETVDVSLFFKEESSAKLPQKNIPILNPNLITKIYQWPVHQICKNFCSRKIVKKNPTSLIVYRHPEDLKIRFMESNPLVHDLIQLIKKEKISLEHLFKKLAKKNKIAFDNAAFFAEAAQTLRFLKEKGILYSLGNS